MVLCLVVLVFRSLPFLPVRLVPNQTNESFDMIIIMIIMIKVNTFDTKIYNERFGTETVHCPADPIVFLHPYRGDCLLVSLSR